MLGPWLDQPGVADLVDRAGAAAGLDLLTHGTTSGADTIRDTAVAQPLIVAASLLSLRVVLAGREPADFVDIVAGHSVGEFAAAAVAGVFDDDAAVTLVSARAAAMARAAAEAEPSGMTAILGGDQDEVLAAIEAAGLWPANVNGAGQVVAAGTAAGLAALAAHPPARARLRPLPVAGAFHTPIMAPARDAFEPIAAEWPATDPKLDLLSNADGNSYRTIGSGPTGFGSAPDVRRRLTDQITAPVRWDLCQETLGASGVTAILELAPGGVLAGLAKRTLPDVERVAIKTPADLDAARDLIDRHAGTGKATA